MTNIWTAYVDDNFLEKIKEQGQQEWNYSTAQIKAMTWLRRTMDKTQDEVDLIIRNPIHYPIRMYQVWTEPLLNREESRTTPPAIEGFRTMTKQERMRNVEEQQEID